MQRVCLAELAILLGFHSLRMCLLILCHVVIPLLAFRTCQCYSYTHNFHLRYRFFVIRAKKKEPFASIRSPILPQIHRIVNTFTLLCSPGNVTVRSSTQTGQPAHP